VRLCEYIKPFSDVLGSLLVGAMDKGYMCGVPVIQDMALD